MLLLPPAAEPLIGAFASAFTRPTYRRFVLLLVGTIVTCGRRTVSRILWTVRSLIEGHPCSYHRFFSKATWSLWPLGKVLAAGRSDAEAASDRHASTERRSMRELTGDHPPIADALRQLKLVEAGALHGEEDGEHGAEEGPCHHRRV